MGAHPRQGHASLLLLIALTTMTTLACSSNQSVPVAPAATPRPTSSADATVTDAAAVTTDCVDSSCKKLNLKMALVQLSTGGETGQLKGETNAQIAWGLKVKPKSGSDTARNILIKVINSPSELDITEKANTAVLLGSFTDVRTGKVEAKFRDVDYCKQKHDEEDECDDMDIDLEDFDETATGTFNVIKSAADTAQQQLLKQQSAAQQAQCISGFLTILAGNLGGVVGCAGMIMGQ